MNAPLDGPKLKREIGDFIASALRGENDGDLEAWLVGHIIESLLEPLMPQFIAIVDALMEEDEHARWADDGGMAA